MSLPRFAGRRAVVTGAASGIGAAVTRALRVSGAEVFGVDLDREMLLAVCEETGAEPLVMDVADPAAWEQVAAVRPTLAHLNAGVGTPGVDLGAFEDASYERIRSVNLDAYVWGVRALVPGMRAERGGSIVMTASTAGLHPYGGDPFYTATKYAVVGFAQAAAQRLKRDAITVDVICPHLTRTPMAAQMIDKIRRTDPAVLVLDPADVAAVVLGALVDQDSGRVLVCQAGRPVRYVEPEWFD